MGVDIHPSAVVHPGAQLGKNISIGPFCLIDDQTIIGDGTQIDAHSQIKSFTRLGADNHVHSYAALGDAPQDLKYRGEDTWLEIGDRNRIREFTTLNRGTAEGGGKTLIGSDCFIMAYAHIAHDCILGDGVILANAATLAGHVHVGKRAVIGGLSAVHQFARIGEFAFIGGKTGVAQDVPPYMLASGERAKLHGPNVIGLRRSGFPQEDISALKKAYRIIWRGGHRKEVAMEMVEQEFGSLPSIKVLLEFLRTSNRGVSGAE
jgi:UDP-N-acetylglucosamine acyltransferase